MRRVLLVAGVLTAISVPVAAQEKGTVEIGGFGRFTKYDGSFSTTRKSENSYGGGGRLGYFFANKWELEADGSFNATDLENYFVGYRSTPVRYWPFHLRGIYNAPLGSKWDFLLGAGPVLNYYGKSTLANNPTINGTDFGVGGLAGLRFKLTHWLALRADGTLDYMPSPRNGKDEVLNQAQGVTFTDIPSKNVHLGAQLGLSVLLGGKCTKRLDAIDLTPNTASVTTGQPVQFNTSGRLCDGSSTTPQVTYSSSGGTVSSSGQFSSNQPGTYQVIAKTLNGKLADTSTVTVTEPPPPPPPPAPPHITSCSIAPKSATLKPGESTNFSVTCNWSDGTSRTMRSDECSLSGTGNPSVSGSTYSWSRSGNYTVTATCGGTSDTANVTVKGLQVVLRAMFGTNQYSAASKIDRMSLDSVAAAMKADASLRAYVDGHTDWRNSTKYNAWLGEKRAQSIKRELIKRGVAANRLFVRSFGECKPVADNGTNEGMAQNRRVEVSQVETDQPEPGDTSCAESGPKGASKIGRPGE